MSKSLRVFSYNKCSTCRNALRFLETHEIAHAVHDIIETPPTSNDLSSALQALGGELKKMFNTSGQQYREWGIAEKLKTMTEREAITLLAKNGKLIKRPFVIWNEGGQTRVLVGFKEPEWQTTLGSKAKT